MAVLQHVIALQGVAAGRGPPASTAVQVTALFAPGYLLEVEAWALVDD